MIKVRFNSLDRRKVSIKIYDVCGRLVHKEDGVKSRIGMNEIMIKPKGFSAGIYFVRLEAGDFKETEKAIILR